MKNTNATATKNTKAKTPKTPKNTSVTGLIKITDAQVRAAAAEARKIQNYERQQEPKRVALVEAIAEVVNGLSQMGEEDVADVLSRVLDAYIACDLGGGSPILRQIAEDVADVLDTLAEATEASEAATIEAVLATHDLSTLPYPTLRSAMIYLGYETGGLFHADLVKCLETHRNRVKDHWIDNFPNQRFGIG